MAALDKEYPSRLAKPPLLLCLIILPVLAVSQTGEIQVNDGEIVPPGILNLMIRKNSAPKERTVPAYLGAILDRASSWDRR